MNQQQPKRVRLAGIDAPESGQPFEQRVHQALANLAGGKPVEVISGKRDRYGRLVGTLIADGRDVNLELVSLGMAWWYRNYASEQSVLERERYDLAKQQARAEDVGLWRDPDPIPPWVWRHGGSGRSSTAEDCPCDSDQVCTGPRGGRYCVRSSGTKRYLQR